MRPSLFLSLTALGFGGVGPCAAQTLIENFSGPGLNAGLEMSLANSFTFSGGVASNTSGADRQYIRTTATNFRSVDFTLCLTYTVADGFGGGGIAFVGLGAGAPDADFYTEPLAALYFRSFPDDFGDGALAPSINAGLGTPSESRVTELDAFGSPGVGTHRAQLVKVGNMVTFSLDANSSSGAFISDYTTSFDLADVSLSFLNDANSRLFFGSEAAGVTFDTLSISAVPEPSVCAFMLGATALGLALRRRHRRG